MLINIKYLSKFTIRYIYNLYYGFKSRIVALFRRQIGILDFIKSIFNLPFEAWSFTKLDFKDGVV